MEEALLLAVKVLNKTMDSTKLTAERRASTGTDTDTDTHRHTHTHTHTQTQTQTQTQTDAHTHSLFLCVCMAWLRSLLPLVEFATMTMGDDGQPVYGVLPAARVSALLKKVWHPWREGGREGGRKNARQTHRYRLTHTRTDTHTHTHTHTQNLLLFLG